MRKPPVASKVAGSGRFFVVYFLADIARDISKKVEITWYHLPLHSPRPS